MVTSCALSIEFHIILVVVLMTIHVFYISIIFYKLLPMFMIHVSFINITLSLFTCFIYQYRFISFYMFHACIYSKEVDTGNNCKYLRVLSLYETLISIRALLYDQNGAAVMTRKGRGPCHQPKQGQLYMYVAATVSLIGMPIYLSTRS